MIVERKLYKRCIKLPPVSLCSGRHCGLQTSRPFVPLHYHLNSLFQKETKVVELKAPMNMSSRI